MLIDKFRWGLGQTPERKHLSHYESKPDVRRGDTCRWGTTHYTAVEHTCRYKPTRLRVHVAVDMSSTSGSRVESRRRDTPVTAEGGDIYRIGNINSTLGGRIVRRTSISRDIYMVMAFKVLGVRVFDRYISIVGEIFARSIMHGH